MERKKIAGLFGIVFLLMFVGFLRDFMFVNINYELIDIYYKRYEWSPPSFLAVFNDWNYDTLYYFKFFLTGLFTLMYCLITILGIRIAFQDKKYLRITIIAFAIIMGLAFLIYLSGFAGIDEEVAYTFSRWLMGFVESPLVLMILVPAFMLHQHQAK